VICGGRDRIRESLACFAGEQGGDEADVIRHDEEKHVGKERLMRSIPLLLLAALFVTSPADAASEFGTKEEAVAMVHRVQDLFNKDGVDATFKAVDDKNNKEFHDRDLYPFILDFKGTWVAHGVRPALIGKNAFDLKDQDGKYMVREMIDITKDGGTGWVDYKWPNPLTNKIEDKSAYVAKLGEGYWVGVGVYSR
jgi:cytochrome c